MHLSVYKQFDAFLLYQANLLGICQKLTRYGIFDVQLARTFICLSCEISRQKIFSFFIFSGASHSKFVLFDSDGKIVSRSEGDCTNQWV